MTLSLPERFAQRFTELRGHAHHVGSLAEAAERIIAIAQEAEATSIALGDLPDSLCQTLRQHAADAGFELLEPPYPHDSLPNALDKPQVGVGRAHFAIANTGTLVEIALDDAFRLVSSLPRTYIGLVPAAEFIEDLHDAAPRLRAIFQEHPQHCVVSFISGPSRTGDIEMILTLGVHGPEAAHAIVVEHWDESDA